MASEMASGMSSEMASEMASETLYTPVWRLTAKAAEAPEVAAWLGQMTPMAHVALNWDARDDAALAHMSASGMGRNALYRMYAVIASVNLTCLDRSLAVYRTLSYLNHACAPNCRVIPASSGEGAARLLAIRDIAEGEEATISFIEQIAEGDDDASGLRTADAAIAGILDASMQRLLYRMYGFKCRCPAHHE